jgi:hypothetical protein
VRLSIARNYERIVASRGYPDFNAPLVGDPRKFAADLDAECDYVMRTVAAELVARHVAAGSMWRLLQTYLNAAELKARGRGVFIERTELTGAGGGPIQVAPPVKVVSEEWLEQTRDLIARANAAGSEPAAPPAVLRLSETA